MGTQTKTALDTEDYLDPKEYQELPEEWYVEPTKEEIELKRALEVGIKEDKKKKLATRNWIVASALTAILAYPAIKFVVWAVPALAHLLWSIGLMWCLVGSCVIAVPAFAICCGYLAAKYIGR
jgi:hypothetical protein